MTWRKQARYLPKALNPDEITRLLAQPNTADPFGLRDRAMLVRRQLKLVGGKRGPKRRS